MLSPDDYNGQQKPKKHISNSSLNVVCNIQVVAGIDQSKEHLLVLGKAIARSGTYNSRC